MENPTSGESPRIIDVAIVGGGVSGAYCAYRMLAERPDVTGALARRVGGGQGQAGVPKVCLYEMSHRVGGRLWSYIFEETPNIPADLGGMHIAEAQKNVYELCARQLHLAMIDVKPRGALQYIRSHRYSMSDYGDPSKIPFWLTPEEKDVLRKTKVPFELLLSALKQVAPGLDQLWPFNPSASPEGLAAYLQGLEIDKYPLNALGFQNVLARHLSLEAYNLLTVAVDSISLLGNWNAHNAFLEILRDAVGAGSFHRLVDGYEELPRRLISEFEGYGGELHRGHRLLSVKATNSDCLRLAFSVGGGRQTLVDARHVILAMPQRSLQMLDSDSVLYEGPSFVQDLLSVSAIPASKTFMTYAEPWWEKVEGGPGPVAQDEFVFSQTDIPLRQCYYLGTEDSGASLLMASYGDAYMTGYWSGYLHAFKDGPTLSGGRGAPGEPPRLPPIPHLMAEEVHRQLRLVHDFEVPEPTGTIYRAWSEDPYGGGWHMWNPHAQSWVVQPRMRKPVAHRNLYVCGESYSDHQGWVEGAINTAELLLQEHFDLPRASWIPSDYDLGPRAPKPEGK